MKGRRLDWWILLGLLSVLACVLSGIWLTSWYTPSPDRIQSAKALERYVIVGQFVRSIHRWGAYGALVSAAVWSFRAVRRSRLGLVLAVGLPVVVLAELITGLSLPWHQMALWVVLRGDPLLGAHSGLADWMWPPLQILWWYGVHLVLLPLLGVGLALLARRSTRSDSVHPVDGPSD